MTSSSGLNYKDLMQRVQGYLLKKGYRPGDRIETESELAAHFKVSRARMREITSTLCHQGLLKRKARAGTVINMIDQSTLGNQLAFLLRVSGLPEEDTREARRVLELGLLPLVIRRITPAQIDRLERILERMESVLDDPKAADRADRDFHLELFAASGNRILHMLSAIVREMFQDDRRKPFWKAELIRSALKEHRDLLSAIREDDTKLAAAILSQHWKSPGISPKTVRKP